MTKALGFINKRNNRQWDGTLVWGNGCLETWGHRTRRETKEGLIELARRLGIGQVKWRKT